MYIRPKNFLKTFRIDLGTELGAEKPEDGYIVLREPNTLELIDLQTAGEGMAKKLLSMIPALLIDHDLYETETSKMSSEAVAKCISDKPLAAVKVMQEYTQAVVSPFQKQTA